MVNENDNDNDNDNDNEYSELIVNNLNNIDHIDHIDILNEKSRYLYHHYKNTGYWQYVKNIININLKIIKENHINIYEYFIDYLIPYLDNIYCTIHDIASVCIYNNSSSELITIPFEESHHLLENLQFNNIDLIIPNFIINIYTNSHPYKNNYQTISIFAYDIIAYIMDHIPTN